METMETKKLIASVRETLDKFNVEYSEMEVQDLVGRWVNSKSKLREILRKNSNWDEDLQAITLTNKDTRAFNRKDFRSAMSNFKSYINDNISLMNDENEKERTVYRLLDDLHCYCCNNVVDDNNKPIVEHHGFKCNLNQKLTRVLAKVIKDTQIEKLPRYNYYFAALCDTLSDLSIDRKFYISIHPCDYLTMSYGNSWTSCHMINSGCYRAGTLSYLEDSTSMIIYTLNKEYEGRKPFLEKKLNRQVFSYNDNMILQSRLYPNDDRESESGKEKIANYRKVVQTVFAECLEIPNYWTLRKDFMDEGYVHTACDSLHYPDYEYEQFNCVLSTLKDYTTNESILIGGISYCLMCGESLSDGESLYCNDCDTEYVECEDCGERIPQEDAYEIDGFWYCRNCVEWCEHCQSYHVGSSYQVDDGDMVCECCLNNHYVYIESNDSYTYYENAVYVDSRSEYFYVDDCCEINGEWYSKDDLVECPRCGEYMLEDDGIYNEEIGEDICEDCHDEIEELKEIDFQVGDYVSFIHPNISYDYTRSVRKSVFKVITVPDIYKSSDMTIEIVRSMFSKNIGKQIKVDFSKIFRMSEEEANTHDVTVSIGHFFKVGDVIVNKYYNEYSVEGNCVFKITELDDNGYVDVQVIGYEDEFFKKYLNQPARIYVSGGNFKMYDENTSQYKYAVITLED